MTRRRWWAPAAWAVLVLLATSIPNLSLPGPTGIDKLGHLSMYCMLAFLTQRAAPSPHRVRTLWRVVTAIAAFAALDEAHQLFVPGRSADVADWVADTVGAALGAAMSFGVAVWRDGSGVTA